MSLNYPNRNDWLKVRCTPRKDPPGRMVHVSTNYAWVRPMLPPLIPGEAPRFGAREFRKMRPGQTYRK